MKCEITVPSDTLNGLLPIETSEQTKNEGNPLQNKVKDTYKRKER